MSISEIILAYLDKKGISQQSLADRLEVKRQFINQKLRRKNDLNSDLILKISIALEHDFFYDLSKELPKEIRQNQTKNESSFVDSAIVDMLKEKYPNIFK